MPNTLHILPTAPLAERVLLPGDPGRALRLAQTLLSEPKMFNHHRGLWGYTGTAADGEPLSIQSTGIGGPSSAIVIHELIVLGARRLLRVGTCGGFGPGLELGQLLIATAALAADGTSRALGAGDSVPATPELLEALLESANGDATPAVIASTDLFYDDRSPEHGWLAAGAVAVEMEASTLFTLARRHGVQAGTLAVVSDLLTPRHARITTDALQRAERAMGQLAARALVRREPASSI